MGNILQGENNLIYLIYSQYEQKQKKKYKSILKKKIGWGHETKHYLKLVEVVDIWSETKIHSCYITLSFSWKAKQNVCTIIHYFIIINIMKVC